MLLRRGARPALALLTLLLPLLAVAGATRPAASALPAPHPFAARAAHVTAALASPPSTRYCRNHYGYSCYSPLQLRHAYDVAPLYRAGVRGAGAVIAIVDSFGSPTIAHDLHVFDQAYGIADPPELRIVRPVGAPPAWDANDDEMTGWGAETTLDVEYAHAMAPQASILLVETPVAETEGVHGFPKMMDAEQWALTHTKVGVISQSFGASEPTFSSATQLRSLRYAFEAARRAHVTVLGASGDTGSTDYKKDMQSLYHHAVDSWPSSDPLVTSVGGTRLHLDSTGHRTKPDSVWNDGYGASGGGLSAVFARPGFQDGVRGIVGSHRGTPDISMNAATTSAVPIYTSFPGWGKGWWPISGTSEATPLFAGIVALAIQQAGHPLGDLNPALYAMRGSAEKGVRDVVGGDNGFGGVPGWKVTTGYDLGTGWGTVDAATFVPALVKAVAATR